MSNFFVTPSLSLFCDSICPSSIFHPSFNSHHPATHPFQLQFGIEMKISVHKSSFFFLPSTSLLFFPSANPHHTEIFTNFHSISLHSSLFILFFIPVVHLHFFLPSSHSHHRTVSSPYHSINILVISPHFTQTSNFLFQYYAHHHLV